MADQKQNTRVQKLGNGQSAVVREDGAIYVDLENPQTGKPYGWMYNAGGNPSEAPAFLPSGSIPWSALPEDERDSARFTFEGMARAVRTSRDKYTMNQDLFTPDKVKEYFEALGSSDGHYKDLLNRAAIGDDDAIAQVRKLYGGEVRQYSSNKSKEHALRLAKQFDGNVVSPEAEKAAAEKDPFITGALAHGANAVAGTAKGLFGSEGIVPTAFMGATIKPMLDLADFVDRITSNDAPAATGDARVDRNNRMAYDMNRRQGTWVQAAEDAQQAIDPSSLYEEGWKKMVSQGPSQLLAMVPQVATGAAGGAAALKIAGGLGVTGPTALKIIGNLGSAFVEATTEAATAGQEALNNASSAGLDPNQTKALGWKAFGGTLAANMALLGVTNNFGVMGDVQEGLFKSGNKEAAQGFLRGWAKDLLSKQTTKEAIKDGLKMAGKEAAQSFMSEGFEEAAQGIIQRMMSSTDKVTMAGFLKELRNPETWSDFVMGGTLGAIAGTASEVGGGIQSKSKGLHVGATSESSIETAIKHMSTPEGLAEGSKALAESAAKMQAEGQEVNPAGVKAAQQVMAQAVNERIGEHKEAFDKFLADRPGRFTSEDLDAAFKQLGVSMKIPADAEAHKWLSNALRSTRGGLTMQAVKDAQTALLSTPVLSEEARSRGVEILDAAMDAAENRNRGAQWNAYVATLPVEQRENLRDTLYQEHQASKQQAAVAQPAVEAPAVAQEAAPSFDPATLQEAKGEIEKRLGEFKPEEAKPEKMTAEMLAGRLALENALPKDAKIPGANSLKEVISALNNNENDIEEALHDLRRKAPQVVAGIGEVNLAKILVSAAKYRTELAGHPAEKFERKLRKEFDEKHGKGFFEAARKFEPAPKEEKPVEKKPRKKAVARVEAPEGAIAGEGAAEGQTSPSSEEARKGVKAPAKKEEKKTRKQEKREQGKTKKQQEKPGLMEPELKKSEGTEATGTRPPKQGVDDEGVSLTKAGKKRGIMSPQADLERIQMREQEMQAEEAQAPAEKPTVKAAKEQTKSLLGTKAITTPAKWKGKTGAVRSQHEINIAHVIAYQHAVEIMEGIAAANEGRIPMGEIPNYTKTWNSAQIKEKILAALPEGSKALTKAEWSAINEFMLKMKMIEPSPASKGVASTYRVVGTRNITELQKATNKAIAERGGAAVLEPGNPTRVAEQLRVAPYQSYLAMLNEKDRAALELMFGIGPAGSALSHAVVADMLKAAGYKATKSSVKQIREKITAALTKAYPVTAPTAPDYLNRIMSSIDQMLAGRVLIRGDKPTGVADLRTLLGDESASSEYRGKTKLTGLMPKGDATVAPPTVTRQGKRWVRLPARAFVDTVYSKGDGVTARAPKWYLGGRGVYEALTSLANQNKMNWIKEIALISKAPGWSSFKRETPSVGEDGTITSKQILEAPGFLDTFTKEVNTKIEAIDAEIKKLSEGTGDVTSAWKLSEQKEKLSLALGIVKHIGHNADLYVSPDALLSEGRKGLDSDALFDTWIGSGVPVDSEEHAAAIEAKRQENQQIVQDAYSSIEAVAKGDEALKDVNFRDNTMPEIVEIYGQYSKDKGSDKATREAAATITAIAQGAIDKTTMPFHTGMTGQDVSGLMTWTLMAKPETSWVPGGISQPAFETIREMEFSEAVNEVFAIGNVLKGEAYESYRDTVKAIKKDSAEPGSLAEQQITMASMAAEVGAIIDNKMDRATLMSELSDMMLSEQIGRVRSLVMEGTKKSSRNYDDATFRALAWVAQNLMEAKPDGGYAWAMAKMNRKGEEYTGPKTTQHTEADAAAALEEKIVNTSAALAGVLAKDKLTAADKKKLSVAQRTLVEATEALNDAKEKHGDDNGGKGGGRVPYSATWAVANAVREAIGTTSLDATTATKMTTPHSAVDTVAQIMTDIALSGRKMSYEARASKALELFKKGLQDHADARFKMSDEDFKTVTEGGQLSPEAVAEYARHEQEFKQKVEANIGGRIASDVLAKRPISAKDAAWIAKDKARREKVIAAQAARSLFNGGLVAPLLTWVHSDPDAASAVVKGIGLQESILTDLYTKAADVEQMTKKLAKLQKQIAQRAEKGKTQDAKRPTIKQLEAVNDANAFIANAMNTVTSTLADAAANVAEGLPFDDGINRLERAAEALQVGLAAQSSQKSGSGGVMAMGLAPLGFIGMDGSPAAGLGMLTAVVGLELGARYLGRKMGVTPSGGMYLSAVGTELFKRAGGKLMQAVRIIQDAFSSLGRTLGIGQAATLAKYASPQLEHQELMKSFDSEPEAVERALDAMVASGAITQAERDMAPPAFPERMTDSTGKATPAAIQAVVHRAGFYARNPGVLAADYVREKLSMEGRWMSGDLMSHVIGGQLGSDFWNGMLNNPGVEAVVDRAIIGAWKKLTANRAAATQAMANPAPLYYVIGGNGSGKTTTARKLLKNNPSAYAEEGMIRSTFLPTDWASQTGATIQKYMEGLPDSELTYLNNTITRLDNEAGNNLNPIITYVFNDDLDRLRNGVLARLQSEGRAIDYRMVNATIFTSMVGALAMKRLASRAGFDFMMVNGKDFSVVVPENGVADSAIKKYISTLTEGRNDLPLYDIQRYQQGKFRKVAETYFASRPGFNPFSMHHTMNNKQEVANEQQRVDAAIQATPPDPNPGGRSRSGGGSQGSGPTGGPSLGRGSVGNRATASGNGVVEGAQDLKYLQGGIGGTQDMIAAAADRVESLLDKLRAPKQMRGAGAEGGVVFKGDTPSPTKGKTRFGTKDTNLRLVQNALHNVFRQTAVNMFMTGGAGLEVMRAMQEHQDTKTASYGKVEPVLASIKERSKTATPEEMANLYTAVMLSSVRGSVLPDAMLNELGLDKASKDVYNEVVKYAEGVREDKLQAIDDLQAQQEREYAEQIRNAQTKEEFDRIAEQSEELYQEMNKNRAMITANQFYLPLYRSPEGTYKMEMNDGKEVVGVSILTKDEAKDKTFVRQAASQMLDQLAQKKWAESDGSRSLSDFRAEIQEQADAGTFTFTPPTEDPKLGDEFRKHANALKGVYDEAFLQQITGRLRGGEGASHIGYEAYKAMLTNMSYVLQAAPLAAIRANRQNVPGWSADLPDVLRRYAWAEGNALAQMTTVPKLRSALADMQKAAGSSASSISKADYDYAMDYVHKTLAPTKTLPTKAVRGATAMLFYKTMALKPVTGFVNGFTQGWLTSNPFLQTVYRDFANRDEIYKQAERAARGIVYTEMAGLGSSISQLSDAELSAVLDKYITPERFGINYADKEAMASKLALAKEAIANWVRSGLRETNTSDVTTFEGGSAGAVARENAGKKVREAMTYFMEKSEVANRLRDVMWSSIIATSDKQGGGILRVMDRIDGNSAHLETLDYIQNKNKKAVDEEMFDLDPAKRAALARERTAREITQWAEVVNAINNFNNSSAYGSRMTWGSDWTRALWVLRGFGTNVMYHMGAMRDLHDMLDRGTGTKSSWLAARKPYIRGIVTAVLMSGLFGMSDDLADLFNLLMNLFVQPARGKAKTFDVRREVYDAVHDLGASMEKNIMGKDTGVWARKMEDFARGGMTRPFGADLGGMMNISNAIDFSRGASPFERAVRGVMGPWTSIADAATDVWEKPDMYGKFKAAAPAGLAGPLDAVMNAHISQSVPEAGDLNYAERALRVVGINPTARAHAFDAMSEEMYVRDTMNEIRKQARNDFQENGRLSERTIGMLEDLREYERRKGMRVSRRPTYGNYLRNQNRKAASIMED